jgi:hypothetical protein
MTVSLSLFAGAGAQFFTNTGAVLSGGKIYSYAAGTTTPQATYTSKSGSTAHPNPIILDAAGRVPSGEIWLTLGTFYKFVLQDSNDVLIATYDNIEGALDYASVIAIYSGTNGSSLIGTVQKMNGTLRTVQAKLNDWFNVMDFGAYGDGQHDDTAAIQAAIDAAGSILTNGQPPSIYMNGGQSGYAAPVVMLPPGAYRLTNTLRLYTGMVLMGQNDIAYTVESTRLIMDTATNAAVATGNEPGGVVNLDKPIIKMQKTYTPTGTVLQPNNCSTIANIGFWIVNPLGTINSRGGIGFAINPSSGLGSSGTGSAIYCDEPMIDSRIKRCNFYAIPNAAVWLDGAGQATKTVKNVEIEECEFDGPIVSVRLDNVEAALVCNNSKFFSGSFQLYATSVTGFIYATGCQFEYQARIKIAPATLNEFLFVSNKHDGSGTNGTSLDIDSAKKVTIVGNHFGLSVESTINVLAALGGTISNNTIVNSGYNAPAVSPITSAYGAIRLVGCQNVVVEGNSILTPDAATYNNFGIYLLDGTLPSKNIVSNNFVSGEYNNTGYRDQPRRINVTTADILNDNYTGDPDTRTPEWRIHDGWGGRISLYRQGQISASTTSDLSLTGMASAKATYHFAALSTADNAMFEVLVGNANTTNTYSILNVIKDGVAGAGNGPHTISAGPNTVTFSINGANIRATYSIATDPILASIQFVGAKKISA